MIPTEVTNLFIVATAILVVSQLSTILSFRYFTIKNAILGMLLLIFGFGSNLALLFVVFFVPYFQ